MRNQRVWGWLKVALVTAFIVVGGATTAFAQSSSNNYKMTEMEFGGATGGQACSDSYCAQVSIGDPEAVVTASTAELGEIQYDEPLLQVIVEPGESDLGVMSTETTATKTTKVKIRNYLSGGYAMQVVGSAPQYDGYTLKSSATPVASDPGTEQFGINLAANTSPSLGAAPVQIPDSGVFGLATTNYNTPNLFKYTSGDVVATSQSDSGHTEYTISMIINIDNSTPAGKYTSDFSVYVVPTL